MPDSPLHLPEALRGYSVIYFGNDWFAENRTSSHHIARRLSSLVPVLYIETPGIRAPQSTARDLRKLWRKLRAGFAPPKKVHEKLYVQTIPQIPFRKLPLVNLVNRMAGRWLARRAAAKLGFTRRLSWFVTPQPGALARRLGEALTVYYCIDDYASYPGMDPVAIQALDDELTRRSDIVFVAPVGLVEAKRALNAAVRYSPHGVDSSLFAQASDPATKPPEAAPAVRHPVIGYFGTIGEWMDFELVSFLAKARPEWTFLFVGFASADVSALRQHPNVVLAGPQRYEELPRWASLFDAAIYPQRVNRQVKHSNPLKIREYLATGKPVVSVTTPETAKLSGLLYLADRPEDYLAAIERALAEDSPARRSERMEAMKPLSWDARFQETIATVADALKTRRG